jgi:glycosyltransferase involved in cell wall biosynthesis
MISVLILTLNEEVNVASCLRSVNWSDDITVFDSFSTDETVRIAKGMGARILQRHWDGERSQRTAALQIGFKHAWVYSPDADELTTPELAEEMQEVVADHSRLEVAYRMRRRDMFMGRWIKRSSLYPTWLVRLFRPERVRFERNVNLRSVIDGSVGTLRHHLDHYSFNKGLSAWIDKHNRYSWAEAQEAVAVLTAERQRWRQVFARDPVRRREGLKVLSLFLPGRPALRFLYNYILRRGFLDGRPGLIYCGLMAWYEWMIDLKIREIRQDIGARRG